ncbi:hypothetical protein V565_122670 [Rhizoctonia solani 123E]|uniref:Uncharacterized protein n=1 Tax=Rhizoctonia solani 123E TaxID=1423351 RepID=A0A074RN36_9AGAM|nr:hypothetical protein V565_122670 [Rhizoctonia solani 123E]
MSTQTYISQAPFPQVSFSQDPLDFNFMDFQSSASNALPNADLVNDLGFVDIPNVELDESLMNMCFNLSPEEVQQMINSFSAPLTTLHQETQPVPPEINYFQQDVPPQISELAVSSLPQPPMIVPSQAPISFQSAAAPEQPEPAPVASSSKTPCETTFLNATTLLKLNLRFNPLFQNMGIASCPDRIDLKAGMEREDAMMAAGYIPQTHIPWEQSLKLLGKQGFRTYYYAEMKKARASNVELPPVPEWITRHCFPKGADKKLAGPSKISPTASSLKNKQRVAKVMLARNNPTRKSKAAAASQKNKGKGKAVDTQHYNPHARQ